jgi:hypothetical protein
MDVAAGAPANGADAESGSPGPDASGSTSPDGDQRQFSANGKDGIRQMSMVGLLPGH